VVAGSSSTARHIGPVRAAFARYGRTAACDCREVSDRADDTADRLATAEIESAKLGQSLAFTLTLFVAAVVFFALGNRWAGVAFTSVPVAMLIRSFLRRSNGGTT
jgi:hypothetical protein